MSYLNSGLPPNFKREAYGSDFYSMTWPAIKPRAIRVEANRWAIDLLSELKWGFYCLDFIWVCFVSVIFYWNAKLFCCSEGICSNKCVKSNQFTLATNRTKNRMTIHSLIPKLLPASRVNGKCPWAQPRFAQWECVPPFQLIMCCGEVEWSDSVYVIRQGANVSCIFSSLNTVCSHENLTGFWSRFFAGRLRFSRLQLARWGLKLVANKQTGLLLRAASLTL